MSFVYNYKWKIPVYLFNQYKPHSTTTEKKIQSQEAYKINKKSDKKILIYEKKTKSL